jgi:hypothetical protein
VTTTATDRADATISLSGVVAKEITMSVLQRASESLPPWFRDTTVGRSIVESQRKAEYAARQALVDQVAARHRDATALDDKHARIITPLFVAATDARAAATRAETKLRAAQRRRENELAACKGSREQLERRLRESADPRIDAAKSGIGERFERERPTIFRVKEFPTGRMNDRGSEEMRQVTNEPRIRALHVAMREARQRLEALKLQNPPDVAAAIAAILDSIPWAATLTVDPPSAA